MSLVLLDTHTWAWVLTIDPRLSAKAEDAILASDRVTVSPVTFFEITQKVRLGKWPEIAPYTGRLLDLLYERGGIEAPLTAQICHDAGALDWPHRDPFDRIIAATAQRTGATLISADTVFDTLPAIRRVW